MKILALDDLAICTGDRPNDWYSISNDVHGLPQVQAQMARRAGRQPTVGNIERLGRQFSILSYFPHNARATSKTALLTKLASLETMRVLGGDASPPTEPLLWLGPWDLYTAGGSWFARDVLSADRQAMISGALHVVDGPWAGTRALSVEQATTNLCVNPSFEVNVTDGWSLAGGTNPIRSRSSSVARFGSYSAQLQAGSTAGGRLVSSNIALADGETITMSVYAYQIAANVARLIVYDLTNAMIRATVDAIGTRQWERLVGSWTNNTGGTVDVQVWLVNRFGDGATSAWFDGVQAEKLAAPTSYTDGTLGTGYAWTGAAHNSTSTRAATNANLDAYVSYLSNNNAVTHSIWVQARYDADATWPTTSGLPARVVEYRGADDSNRVGLRFEPSTDDQLSAYINGAVRITATNQTFVAGDWLHLVLALDFGSNAYHLYLNGELVGSSTASLTAPTSLATWKLGTLFNGDATYGGGWAFNEYTVYNSILSPEQVAALYQTRINPRWLNAVCLAANPERYQAVPNDYALTALMQIDGDTAWRQRDGDYVGTSIYSDAGSVEAVNEGNVEAFPVFRLTPTVAKTTGFTKARWVPVKWNSANGATRYPIDLSDGGLNLSADAQGDGDDIRVYSDGYELDRWLAGTLVTSVKIWANLDFDPTVSLTLAASVGSSDTELTLSEAIDDLPDTGIVMIDSEAIVYTERNTLARSLSGLTRGARGTSAASHTAATAVHWIQHDIWVYYGDSSLTAPVVNDNYKPIFNLSTSTNASWVYQDFGQDHGQRAAQWVFTAGTAARVTDTRGGSADPWVEIGLMNESGGLDGAFAGSIRCWLYNPCGISGVAWTNGEAYATNSAAHFTMRTYHYDTGYIYDYTHSFSAPNTWESWSYSASSFVAGTLYTGLSLQSSTVDHLGYFQAADCTITVASATRPVIAAGAAQNIYQLDCVIENEATDQQLMLTTMMTLGETLIVDTDARTITLGDGSGRLSAKSLDTVRIEWLPLTPGSNVLTFTDAGTTGLRFEMLWDRRYVE